MKNYAMLKLAYKNLSAYGGSDLFSIGSNVFTDFLNECKLVDSMYALSDFGVNLSSTLIQKEKGQLYNPGNSLVRYEFIEILVRVAADRYIRNKLSNNIVDAIEKMIKENILGVASKFTSDKWRVEKYLCEEVDLVIKANKEVFLAIFRKYSGKHTLPGKKPFTSLDEFRSLCNDIGLIGENFATREIDLCFSQAMITQIDELYSKRHMEMSFVEMLEGLSRAIDCSDAITSNGSSKIFSIIQNDLSKKIESSIEWLLKVCPQGFQSDFNYPSREVYSRMMYKIKV